MTERVLSADDLCDRLTLNPTRFGMLVQEGAIPRARWFSDRTGWLWSEVKNSSFVLEPEKWNERETGGYGPHCVYFIAINEFVKIGYTGSLRRRLWQMQSLSPYPIELLHSIPGDEFLEEYLHAKFSHLRHRGEWFLRDAELIDFIARHMNEPETAL